MIEVNAKETPMTTMEQKIERNRSFWERTNREPLVAFSIGNYFISRRYNAADALLVDGKKIEPEMINVQDFREDYLRMYRESEAIDHDMVYVAEPYTGLPWIEAMLGADVYATKNSFIATVTKQAVNTIDLSRVVNRAWYDTYMEFLDMLSNLDEAVFPVGQPIIRGPSDVVGSLIGQDTLVYYMYDAPERTSELLHQVVDFHLSMTKDHYGIVKPFSGGYGLGYYSIWCPEKCVWFQDDLNALLSPELYEAFMLEPHKRMAESYPYTLFHLHPASFFVIDYLLEMDGLGIVEINKDFGGPSVAEMIPVLQKVQKKKNLVIWGDFTKEEFSLIKNSVDPEGLYIIVYTEDGSMVDMAPGGVRNGERKS